jgi:hypothetical protein
LLSKAKQKKFGILNALLTVPFTAKFLINFQQGFASKTKGRKPPYKTKQENTK